MTLFCTYFSPTTPGAATFSVDMSGAIRLGSLAGLSGEAQLGSVGIGGVVFDDPGSTIGYLGDGIVGLKQMFFTETACPAGEQRLWTGYIADRRYYRGEGDSLILGADRKVDTTLLDVNSFLEFRVFAPVADDPTSDFDRPAETDIARINALLTDVDFLSTTLFDIGYVNTANPVDLDENDYTGSRPQDVLSDCAQMSGKNFFVMYDEATNQLVLWYDYWYSDGSATIPFDSTLSLTNVFSEQDETTVFAIAPDAVGTLDPSRVVSAVYLPYDGGTAYRTLPSTANTFAWRDAVAPSVSVKTLAKAEFLADRYLAENSTEDPRITCSVRLPREKVTAIREGMRIQVHFTHIPLVNSEMTWTRILQRTIRQDQETEEFYWLDLELSPMRPTDSFLIAFQANGFDDQPEDDSIIPWTSLEWTGDFTLHSVIACGAGPPSSEGGGIYARLISGGESSAVGTFKLDANSTGGTHVYQIGGIDITTVMGALTTTNAADFVPDGGTATISQVAATESVLIGMILGGKVNYDDGWCSTSSSNWGGVDLMTTVLGTELVNKSSYNTCGGQTPWVWIGYVVGTGTLTLSAILDAHGGGSGAYTCGYNVGLVSMLIPLTGAFSVVQHGFGFADVPGDSYTVSLPSSP